MATKVQAGSPEPQGMTDLRDIGESMAHLADLEKNRLVYWYDLPPRLAAKTGYAKVGLIEMTSGEEMMATRRANGDPIRLAFELAKECFRYVIKVGETAPFKLLSGDGTSDTVWESSRAGMSNVRQLILGGYAQIHNPEQGEPQSFLASRQVIA